MSKGKKFFLVSQVNSQLLRDKFQKRLVEKGFIEEIPICENETIVIEETNQNAKLRKVIITQLNDNLDKFTIKRIWRVNLEKEILGISSKNLSKTPECALLVLQEFNSEVETISYKLTIILIELKSTLKIDLKPNKINAKPERSEIEEKLISGMNRLYMLLSLNNHLNPIQGYNQASIYIEFKGVIVYNKTDIHDPNNDNPLCLIINHSTADNVLTVETILNDHDKITIKCFPKQSQDSEEKRDILLKDLLN
jgi:hypothetical protein